MSKLEMSMVESYDSLELPELGGGRYEEAHVLLAAHVSSYERLGCSTVTTTAEEKQGARWGRQLQSYIYIYCKSNKVFTSRGVTVAD